MMLTMFTADSRPTLLTDAAEIIVGLIFMKVPAINGVDSEFMRTFTVILTGSIQQVQLPIGSPDLPKMYHSTPASFVSILDSVY